MKHIFTIFMLFFLISCNPSNKIAQDVEDIKAALHQSAVDWTNGDLKSYMNVYWKSEKLKFVGANGITYGWQQTFDNYNKRYPTAAHRGNLTFEVLEVDFLAKNVYSLIGKFYLEREIGNTEGIFTLIFKKMNGNWVIISDHTQ